MKWNDVPNAATELGNVPSGSGEASCRTIYDSQFDHFEIFINTNYDYKSDVVSNPTAYATAQNGCMKKNKEQSDVTY